MWSEVKWSFTSKWVWISDPNIISIFEENKYDGLLIVFICDGQSDSISINIVISIDRLVVYTTVVVVQGVGGSGSDKLKVN